MKCKNCGANYMLRELKCPYCGTENAIGRIWHAQRTEAELEYEKKRIAEGRKISPYVTTRALSRIIILQILVLIILSAVSYAFDEWTYRNTYDKVSSMKTETLRENVRELYEKGEYREMGEMAYELYRRDNYDNEESRLWRSVADVTDRHDTFLSYKMRLEALSDDEINEDKYLLRYAIYYAFDSQDPGYYYDEIPEEVDRITAANREDARAWLYSMSGDKELVDRVLESDRLSDDDWNELESRIRDKNGWAHVVYDNKVEDAE